MLAWLVTDISWLHIAMGTCFFFLLLDDVQKLLIFLFDNRYFLFHGGQLIDK